MAKFQKQILTATASPLLCGALLMGVVLEARTRVRAADADPFHKRAKEAVEQEIAANLDPEQWSSQEAPVPPSAIQLLRPNAIFSRNYLEHLSDNRAVYGEVLVDQCRDARDMQGHYPPNCYPAAGDQQISSMKRTWIVGGLTIDGMEYMFKEPQKGLSDERCVYNFFIIPSIPGLGANSIHGIYPDIQAVYKSGEDYQRRYYGAAQFQFVFSAEYKRQDRDRFLVDFLTPNLGPIAALLNDNLPVNIPPAAPVATADVDQAPIPPVEATALDPDADAAVMGHETFHPTKIDASAAPSGPADAIQASHRTDDMSVGSTSEGTVHE